MESARALPNFRLSSVDASPHSLEYLSDHHQDDNWHPHWLWAMRGKPFEEVRYLRLSRVVEQYIEVQEYKLDLNKLAVFQGNKDYIVND